MTGRLLKRDEPHAQSVAHQVHDVVNFEALHYFAAMALDCLDAQLEARRDVSRAVPFGNQSKHFDLSRRERFEWAAQVERVGDRCGEPAEISLDQEVFGSSAETGYGLVAVGMACHDDQRRRGSNFSQHCKGGMTIKLRERVIGKDDIRLELAKRDRERVFGLDAVGDGCQAGSPELVTDQLGVALVVFE